MRIPTLAVNPIRYQQIKTQLGLVCKPSEGMSSDLLNMIGISILQDRHIPLTRTTRVRRWYSKKHPRKAYQPKYRTIEEEIIGYWIEEGHLDIPWSKVQNPNVAILKRMVTL